MADPESKLTGRTWVPMAGAIMVLATCVSGAWAMRGALDDIDTRLSVIEEKLERATDDRWHARDMRMWVNLFRELNHDAAIRIPEVPQ